MVKSSHCEIQNRPLRVKPGQYRQPPSGIPVRPTAAADSRPFGSPASCATISDTSTWSRKPRNSRKMAPRGATGRGPGSRGCHINAAGFRSPRELASVKLVPGRRLIFSSPLSRLPDSEEAAYSCATMLMARLFVRVQVGSECRHSNQSASTSFKPWACRSQCVPGAWPLRQERARRTTGKPASPRGAFSTSGFRR
jgi:hypothetical protein